MRVTPRIILPLAILLAMVSAVGIRVLHGARSELRAAGIALSAGDEEEAIVHFERALHWYVPIGSASERALSGLWRVGQRAESAGDRNLALEAYRAIRNGLYATRSFYVPHHAWLERVNRRIAALEVSAPGGVWPDPSLPEDQRLAVALEVLERDTAPDPGWSALAVAGFLGWVGAALGFIWHGFDSSGLLRRGPARLWGAGFLASYALWILGMAKA